MNETQPTGGQPTPEAVEQAARDSGQLPFGRTERWILTQPWRHGKRWSSVVCDAPPWFPGGDVEGSVEFFGGFRVFETCVRAVADAIIRQHNEGLDNTLVEQLQPIPREYGTPP